MNYLVHLSLSYPNSGYLVGNFVFDLLPRALKNKQPPELQAGIQLHKLIDHLSNNHTSWLKMNASFHPYIHKYASVVSDVVCDHLMYLLWNKYGAAHFDTFTDWNYDKLIENLHLIPEPAKTITKSMVDHQWMDQYRTLEGVEQVLRRMNQKLKFDCDLTAIMDPFSKNMDDYLDLFNSLYPDLRQECQKWISLQNEVRL
ncbi:MAG: DUF479 domain-containing protein [Saprospiraceae bacterium]|nr:DUF479 domain-containing protein [Saprospiraceae bacterium]